LLPYQLTAYLKDGLVPGRHGTAFPLIAPYQAFQARDGALMIAAGNDGLFTRLCEALDLQELAADPRFATNPDRLRHREELTRLLADRIRDDEVADVLELLERAGIPVAPVNDVGSVADHEQTAALGLIQPLAEPTVAFPLSFEGERLVHRSAPPRLGEHTDEILRELGYAEREIEAFEQGDVILRAAGDT
jgi:crotonobetainyl-CoA:carnitine CoA-transferase CaiB-like acyl-CoA transferase